MKHILGIILILIPVGVSYAQWPAIPSPNVAVTSQAGSGIDSKDFWAAPDGVGGSYAVWQDERNDPGNFAGIFCQRIRSNGMVKFAANGIEISDIAGSDQKRPKAAEGTNSSALIVWEDERNSGTTLDDIYAKSIDSVGTTLWGGAEGIVVCNAADNQERPQIVTDGSSGAIIVWRDKRTGGVEDIYAQRINSSGLAQWTANGVVITAAIDKQSNHHLIADGSGGAIIAWEDDRSGTNTDIYIQKINSSGVVQWTADGVAVCTAADNQARPQIVSDGAGGAIITWEDPRTAGTEDIYAQRVTSAGVIASGSWVTDGVLLCGATDTQKRPTIVSDNAGGAMIIWEDARSGTSDDIYIHRISGTGVPYTSGSWVANGIAVSTATNNQARVHASPTDIGAALIAWEDNRTGKEDVYVEAIQIDGSFLSGVTDGLQITSNAEIQARPFIFQNNTDEWITLWEDDRNDPGGNNDVYAQGINSTIVPAFGPLPIELVSFSGQQRENEVVISWETASEINNDYFTMEKSIDRYAAEFFEIGTIPGAGNSLRTQFYNFIDTEPHSLNYYRLRQTDYDGTSVVSNVILVEFDLKKIHTSFYPNPFDSDGATLIIHNPEREMLEVKFFDLNKKEVWSFETKENRIYIDTSKFKKGLYTYLLLKNDVSIDSGKIIRIE